MSKTNREERREEKEGNLRTVVVDGLIIVRSDPRIARPLAKPNKNRVTQTQGKKPRIVFA